jgi:hypothetical protein
MKGGGIASSSTAPDGSGHRLEPVRVQTFTHRVEKMRPVSFNPGRSFRHPLNLIAGNLEAIRRAIQENAELAREIASGVILHGNERGRELQAIARAAHGHAQTG